MKTIINGKNYDTDTMTVLVSQKCHHNGNYCGSDSIRITKNGAYAYVRTSNGLDLRRSDSVRAVDKEDIAELIDGWIVSDNEHEVLVRHNIIEEA